MNIYEFDAGRAAIQYLKEQQNLFFFSDNVVEINFVFRKNSNSKTKRNKKNQRFFFSYKYVTKAQLFGFFYNSYS